MRRRRPVAVIVATTALAAAALLSGCAPIDQFLHSSFPDQFGPQRDDDGRVTGATEAHAYYLAAGDCFSFTTPGVRTEVTIVPCAEEHAFEVIGQGEVSLREQKETGTQQAVSAKCAEPFAEFQQRAPAGSRPDQEFLITERQDGDRTTTVYSCAASLTKL